MNKIKLYNRDGANLWLEKGKNIESNVYEWTLHVDKNHDWVLNYTRVIGDYTINDENRTEWISIEAVDPSGGPFLSKGSMLIDESKKSYKIIKIINARTFWLSEGDNN